MSHGTSGSENHSGTTCEERCPLVTLRTIQGRDATSGLDIMPDGYTTMDALRDVAFADPYLVGRLARVARTAAVGVPAHVKAAWACPRRSSRPEEWQPDPGCVEKAEKLAPRIYGVVQVTQPQLEGLEASGVTLYYPPEVV